MKLWELCRNFIMFCFVSVCILCVVIVWVFSSCSHFHFSILWQFHWFRFDCFTNFTVMFWWWTENVQNENKADIQLIFARPLRSLARKVRNWKWVKSGTYFGYLCCWFRALDRIPPYENPDVFLGLNRVKGSIIGLFPDFWNVKYTLKTNLLFKSLFANLMSKCLYEICIFLREAFKNYLADFFR